MSTFELEQVGAKQTRLELELRKRLLKSNLERKAKELILSKNEKEFLNLM
jgi:hypothetical protein